MFLYRYASVNLFSPWDVCYSDLVCWVSLLIGMFIAVVRLGLGRHIKTIDAENLPKILLVYILDGNGEQMLMGL